MKCTDCKGKGYNLTPIGNGGMDMDGVKIYCDTCNGTGEVEEEKQNCSSCSYWDLTDYYPDIKACLYKITKDMPTSCVKEDMYSYDGTDCPCWTRRVEDK